ncbi:MAG TPA: DUF2905 domain-containing protein [Phycisphaerae bacterium]|jgi:drug/metabolite transporter (DMT)-like permease|nr:DUF2905 domain-containing protein [Phycisphaerae bacterium]HRS29307.1 DUF2905 domain-containing protein [Phycisphaerae bacterium]HRT42079.1 DUF2905 domain-containing protein [Phycisphaerae bacterium]
MNLGKLLVIAGLTLAIIGALIWGFGRLGIRRLPGDIYYQSDGVRIYIPIVTCLVLSILLTAVIWIWQWLGRR